MDAAGRSPVTRLAWLSPSRLPPDWQAFAAISAAMALITVNGLRLGEALTASDVLLAVAAVLLAITAARTRTLPMSVPVWLPVAGAGLLAAGFLVELFPPSRPSQIELDREVSLDELEGASNLGHLVRFEVALVAAPLLIAAGARTFRRAWLLIGLWLGSVALNCLVAVADSLGARLDDRLTGVDYTVHVRGQPDRMSGLMTHPVGLSLACAMAMPVAVWLTLNASGRRRLALTALVGLLVVGIVLTAARAGLVGGALGAVVILVIDRRFRRTAVIVVIAAAVAIPAGAAAGIQGAERLLGRGTAVASDERRTLGYEQAWADIQDRFVVGWGFRYVRSAHNIYLQVLQAGGVLALAAFLTFVWGTLRAALRLSSHREVSEAGQGMARALAVSMGVWLLFGLVQNSIFDRYLYVPAGLLLGLCTAAGLPAAGAAAAQRETPPGRLGHLAGRTPI